MQNLKNRGTISVRQIVFFIVTLIMTLSYISIVKFSFGIELIAIAALIAFVYFKRLSTDVIGWIAVMFITLILLIISGRFGERGFNAPIGHALKFVCLSAVHAMALAVQNFTYKQKKLLLMCIFSANVLSIIVSIYNTIAVDVYAIRYFEERGFTTVTDFNQAYAIPILLCIVGVLFLFSHNKLSKMLLMAMMGLCFFFLVKSLYTFALLMGMMGIVLVVAGTFWNRSRKKTLVILTIILVLICCVYLFAEPFANWLYDITEGMNWIVRARIRLVIDTVLLTEHDNWYTSERRDELAGYSMDTFLKHPMFGAGYSGYGYGVIGCHQEWADLLGVFGITGMLIFIVLFGMSTGRTFRRCSHLCDRVAFAVALLLFIVQGFLNPCLSLPILAMVFIVAPNISVLLEKELNGTVK